MNEGITTVLKCAVAVTEGAKVAVGLHQGSNTSPFPFAIVMDRLTHEVRLESASTVMLAHNIGICRQGAGGRTF